MKIAALIATRDRPKNLMVLLNSLQFSSKKFDQIVIVSSGLKISNLIQSYKFKIDHIHLEGLGQAKQKIQGIRMIEKDIDWVLFLDDDVTMTEQAFDTLIADYIENPQYNSYSGFGLKINNLYIPKRSKILKKLMLFFRLQTNLPGSVSKSGHVQEYQSCQNDVETMWLNGVSAWKTCVLHEYKPELADLGYSAFEDVNFSYKISRSKKLLFASRVIINSQSDTKYEPLSMNKFKIGTYIRFVFVSQNQNLSTAALLTSQIIRSFHFIVFGDKSKFIIYRIRLALVLWFDLFFAWIFRTNALTLATRRLKSKF
jgi:GT2 family glycosyltransferase